MSDEKLVTMAFIEKDGTEWTAIRPVKFWNDSGIYDAECVKARGKYYKYAGLRRGVFSFKECPFVEIEV